jgi:hypothetical protein
MAILVWCGEGDQPRSPDLFERLATGNVCRPRCLGQKDSATRGDLRQPCDSRRLSANRSASMVRRGSTVRVRQRALQKPCKARRSVQVDLQMLQCAVGMEPFMELSGPRTTAITTHSAPNPGAVGGGGRRPKPVATSAEGRKRESSHGRGLQRRDLTAASRPAERDQRPRGVCRSTYLGHKVR